MVWYLDSTGDHLADTLFYFGNATDIPLVGDWNGNGTDTIGVYRSGTFYLKDTLTGGAADITFNYGRAGDIPLVGDWDGNSGASSPLATQAATAAGWYAMCFPNPASTRDGVTFRMMGAGVHAVKVSIYDLGGGRVYQSGFETGRSLTWDLYSEGVDRNRDRQVTYLKVSNGGEPRQWSASTLDSTQCFCVA